MKRNKGVQHWFIEYVWVVEFELYQWQGGMWEWETRSFPAKTGIPNST